VDTVEQLIRTQGEYDWSSWGQKGYNLVRGVPVHLMGTEYLIKDLKPVEVSKIMGLGDGDDVKEVLAQGSVRVLRKIARLGERDDPTVVTASMALQFDEPSMGNPRAGYGAGVRRLEFRSAPSPLTGLGAPTGPQDVDGYVSMPSVPRLGYRIPASVPLYPTGEVVASRNTAPSMGEQIHSSDEYYGYPWEERRRSNPQSIIRVADLESKLYSEGRLQEFQELVSSEEWTAETVGQALRRLLESRTNHRY
jgi:hypothetical protein